MKKLYDVLVVGELNVDLILNQIHKFPEMGKEVLADNMTLTLGSSSGIFASNMSVLGAKVAFVGTIGQDVFGDQIIASLQSKGVITDYIINIPEQSTGATIVLNFNEDRANVTYPGAMALLSIEHVSDSILQEARHLHMSSLFLSTGLKKDVPMLFKKAKEMGLTTSLDPQWDPAEGWDVDFKSLLPYVDIFLPNEQEAKALTATKDLQLAVECLLAYGNTIVVKLGADGACGWRGDEMIRQPAFLNNAVVDCIGAGDSFDAGFVRKFLDGKTLKECLEFGALTGALNTTRAGGTGAFENPALVKSLSESIFHYTM